MPFQDHQSLLQELSAQREALTQKYQHLHTDLKKLFQDTQRTTPQLTATLTTILENLTHNDNREQFAWDNNHRTTLPGPLRTQLGQLLSLKKNIIDHAKQIKAVEDYFTMLDKLQAQAQLEATTPAIQTTVAALITVAQTTGFTLAHTQAIQDAHRLLTDPTFHSLHGYNVDELPGGSKPTLSVNACYSLHLISILIALAYLALAIALALICPAIAHPIFTIFNILSPIVMGQMYLAFCLFILRIVASCCGLDPYLATTRIGMAKAMEDLVTAVSADRMVKKFDASLAKFEKYKDDVRIGTAVLSVIAEITALKEAKLIANQPYDKLTDLLNELNALIETGTENAIDTFINRHNTATCITRCTTFFMPAEHYKLDQAVNQLVLALRGHPRILEHMAEETARFEQQLV